MKRNALCFHPLGLRNIARGRRHRIGDKEGIPKIKSRRRTGGAAAAGNAN